MNFAVLKLAPLLTKKPDELSLEDLQAIMDAAGIEAEISEGAREVALALLQGKSIDKVSDIIQSPELIQELIQIFRPQSAQALPLHQCPHCFEFFTS